MSSPDLLSLIERLAAAALPLARAGLHRARLELDEATLRLLGPDFEERLERMAAALPDGRNDPFGFDLDTAKYALVAAAFLHRVYFRAESYGLEHVPSGRMLVIANHSGQLPVDALLVATSLVLDADPPRLCRSMVEKWTQTLPFVGTFFQRVGQVVGVPQNAQRLLEQDQPLLVFPEGAKGVAKPFWRRYELQEFGLGFMRLALKTEAPIVPVAVVGGEEQYVNVGNVDRLAKLLHLPVFPVVPQWLVPGLQLPLPVKYRIYFGEPLRFSGDPDDEDAVIDHKVQIVRANIRLMLDAGLRKRRSIFR